MSKGPEMSTFVISLAEYLTTSYHPDRDYVDGEVQERNLGEFDRGVVQVFLSSWFFQHRQEWQLHCLAEVRVRVSSDRVRIPDVCLVSRSQPVEQVITHPPLAVLEILSPEDRVLRYNERLADYRQMGVRHVWVIDPANKTGYDCGTTGWLPVEEFRVPGSPIYLPLADVWRELESSH